MAKFAIIAIRTTGSTSILSPKSMINGPDMDPNNPNTSVIPTAVDWISGEKDYVWTDAIKVYEIANIM